LSLIEIGEIVRKIENDRNLNLKKLSDNEIYQKLHKVISVNYDGEKHSMLLRTMSSYPVKTRFYRIRKIGLANQLYIE